MRGALCVTFVSILFHVKKTNGKPTSHYILKLVALTNNSIQSVRVGQNDIARKRLKTFSFILVFLATLLLILDIRDLQLVFGKSEVGLWDNFPSALRKTMFLAYPILLLSSYVLFIVSRKKKSNFDFIPNILFLLNGLAVVLLLFIYVIELLKHL